MSDRGCKTTFMGMCDDSEAVDCNLHDTYAVYSDPEGRKEHHLSASREPR